jgi:hypothetical protein
MSPPAGLKSGPAATAPIVRSNSISSKSETLSPSPLRAWTATQAASSSTTRVWQWCRENGVEFTRGRPYRKNDNCFVEQKNGDLIRKAVGYYRFDSDQETAALAGVYRRLYPLANFRYPSIKVSGKERLENGKLKKPPRRRTNASWNLPTFLIP